MGEQKGEPVDSSENVTVRSPTSRLCVIGPSKPPEDRAMRRTRVQGKQTNADLLLYLSRTFWQGKLDTKRHGVAIPYVLGTSQGLREAVERQCSLPWPAFPVSGMLTSPARHQAEMHLDASS